MSRVNFQHNQYSVKKIIFKGNIVIDMYGIKLLLGLLIMVIRYPSSLNEN